MKICSRDLMENEGLVKGVDVNGGMFEALAGE